MVRPTKFKYKYSLIRKTTEKTYTGATKESTSSTLYTDWCDKQPMKGKKRLDYTALGYSQPYTLVMRKRSDYDILPTDTIQLLGVNYRIISVIEIEDSFYEVEVAK
ncbi:MAG: head-tail adaptor protein [Perlabentimonas sp.]